MHLPSNNIIIWCYPFRTKLNFYGDTLLNKILYGWEPTLYWLKAQILKSHRAKYACDWYVFERENGFLAANRIKYSGYSLKDMCCQFVDQGLLVWHGICMTVYKILCLVLSYLYKIYPWKDMLYITIITLCCLLSWWDISIPTWMPVWIKIAIL